WLTRSSTCRRRPRKLREQVRDPNMTRWFKDSRVLWEGATFEDMVANMDLAGIEMGVITAAPHQVPRLPYSVGMNVTDEAFEAACQRFERFVRDVHADRVRQAGNLVRRRRDDAHLDSRQVHVRHHVLEGRSLPEDARILEPACHVRVANLLP